MARSQNQGPKAESPFVFFLIPTALSILFVFKVVLSIHHGVEDEARELAEIRAAGISLVDLMYTSREEIEKSELCGVLRGGGGG